MPEPLLEVKDLQVHFPTDDGLVKAVDGVSFIGRPGETLGRRGRVGLRQERELPDLMGLVTRKQADDHRARSCSRARTC